MERDNMDCRSDLVKHVDVLEDVKNVASNIIEKDNRLKNADNQVLRQKVKKMFGENIQLNL